MEHDTVEVAAEMEDLVGHCLKVAEKLLNEQAGEFQAFAAWLDVAGDLFDALDVSEDMKHVDRMQFFHQGLHEKAALGEIRAAAVCVRATMCQVDPDTGEERDETGLVYISSEHRDSSEAFVDGVTFERTFGLRRRWKLGQRYRNPVPRSIFDDPEGS